MFTIQLHTTLTGTTVEALNQKLYDLGWNQKEYSQPIRNRDYYAYQFMDFFNNLDKCAHKLGSLDYANEQRLMLTDGEDRDCTYEECLAIYGYEMQENQLCLDISYDRGDKESMIACALFIAGNEQHIDWIKDGQELLDKASLTLDPEGQEVLERLEKVEEAPELLLEDERTDRSIQGGVFKAKYWSPAPNDYVHVIFGAVETATFLKDRQYKDDDYNSLYKCDDGRAVLMVTQIPFGQKGIAVAKEAFSIANSLGVQENPYYFIHSVWKNAFALPESQKELKEIAATFNQSYTFAELEERFRTVEKELLQAHPTYLRPMYRATKSPVNRWSYSHGSQGSAVGLLNCLFQAMWKEDKKAAKAVVDSIVKIVLA